MKKAVIVTAYNNPEYLNFFIKQLLSDGTTEVFIHLDKKAEKIKQQINSNEKVHFIANNIDVQWGGYSFLLAIINSWRQVVEKEEYDYVILCSGQDIMVKNNLDEFLQNHPNQVFIDSWEQDKARRAFLLHKWPEKYFRIIDTKLSLTRFMRALRIKIFMLGLPIYKRKVKYDVSKIIFYKNWFWSCIPYQVVKWIINYLDENPDYIDVFKGFVAEEGFIATTIMLSPYKDWLKFDSYGKSYSLTFRKESINNHPPILTKDDVESIEATEKFFARKIDEKIDTEIVKYFKEKYFKEI